jgi:2'-5' RNA ligase
MKRKVFSRILLYRVIPSFFCMSSFRGFIAIDVDPTKKIEEFLWCIRESQADVKLVDINNIHVTLKFLGDVQLSQLDGIIKVLETAVMDAKSFEIKLTGSGVFPNRSYVRVVWIGLDVEPVLEQMVDRLENGFLDLGFKPERRKFSPHLTVGRVRTAWKKDELLAVVDKFHDTEFGVQQVNGIRLMQSELTPEGPVYTLVHETVL